MTSRSQSPASYHSATAYHRYHRLGLSSSNPVAMVNFNENLYFTIQMVAMITIIIIVSEEKYVDLGASYIFEPVAVETLGVLTHQLVTSSMILEGGSLKTRARLERPASCNEGS